MTAKVTFDAPPINTDINDKHGYMNKEWRDWFTQLELLLNELVKQINTP